MLFHQLINGFSIAFIFLQSIYLIIDIAHLHLTNQLIKVSFTAFVSVKKYKETYEEQTKITIKHKFLLHFVCLLNINTYICNVNSKHLTTTHIYKQCFILLFLQTNIILFFLLLTK